MYHYLSRLYRRREYFECRMLMSPTPTTSSIFWDGKDDNSLFSLQKELKDSSKERSETSTVMDLI